MSDFKRMITLLESAEKGRAIQEGEMEYHYEFDETDEKWVLTDSDGNEHGRFDSEEEVKEEKSKLDEQLNENIDAIIGEEDDVLEEEQDADEGDDDSTEYESFWDAFEADSDFIIEPSNESYCVLGADTKFHYGTHVAEEMAEQHADSLRDFK